MLNTVRRALAGGCLGLGLWFVAGGALSQEMPPLPKPGPEHEVLKQDVSAAKKRPEPKLIKATER